MFIAAPDLGDNLSTVVFTALENARIFIALATSTYAEKTGCSASTFAELVLWQNNHTKKGKPPVMPVNMLRPGEKFETSKEGVQLAENLFDNGDVY